MAWRVPILANCCGPVARGTSTAAISSSGAKALRLGPRKNSRIGTRNAMVIAVCSFALALHPDRQRVGTGIGSAGPVPLVADDAERFCEGALAESDLWSTRAPIEESTRRRFGELVAAASRPIDDVRGSAAYRSQALSVLAARVLGWAWADYRRS